MQHIVAEPFQDLSARDDAAAVRAARDDPQAFSVLYERYRDRVYAYLRARTSSVEDAADLTQQVFLRALDALPRYRGDRDAFAAWLFRIARNAAADSYRHRRDTVTWDLVPPALLPQAGRERDELESAVLRREALARLRRLVTALDDDTRELLALRFAAGLTVGEIAAIIGKNEAATRKRLARTLRALAARFEGAES